MSLISVAGERPAAGDPVQSLSRRLRKTYAEQICAEMVLPAKAASFDRLPDDLHAAGVIGEGSALLRCVACREDHLRDPLEIRVAGVQQDHRVETAERLGAGRIVLGLPTLADGSVAVILIPMREAQSTGGQGWRERFLLSAIRNGNDAVIALDRQNTVRFWNRGAEQLFGCDKENGHPRYTQTLKSLGSGCGPHDRPPQG